MDTVQGGGWTAETSNATANPNQGTINMTRIRSGFLGNQFNFGVRGKVTPWTTVTGYVSIWAYIESDQRAKGSPNPADVRQGYAKLEGPWGSFLAGRTRTLFSRGATDIDVLYAHRWGVGFPSSIDNKGPTQGQVGFGVLGSGFAAALIYGTPVLGGFHLNIGAFDPATLSGSGLTRTGYPRAEAEATFERTFGASGKIVLFVNGAVPERLQGRGLRSGHQRRVPARRPWRAWATGAGSSWASSTWAWRGTMDRAWDSATRWRTAPRPSTLRATRAASRATTRRPSSSSAASTCSRARGSTQLFLTTLDQANTPAGTSPNSIIKYQRGYNAGVVYNMTPNVHFDLEYFRAEAAWWLGEQQVLNTAAFGMTFNW